MTEIVKWIVAFFLILAVLGLLIWLGWDMINCINSGGVYVKGLPWYTCVQP